MKKLTLFSLFALLPMAMVAQPRCNADGTVTFQYKNENAKNVQVDVQFAGRKDMTRGADGLFRSTSPMKALRTVCWRYLLATKTVHFLMILPMCHMVG